MASADLMRRDFLLCVGGSRLRFNRKRKAAFLPGNFNQSSGAQVETFAPHRPIDGQFQVGKPAGKFSARQAELGLSPKPARSESELIRNCGRQSGGKPARFADTVYDTSKHV
jgi:hypothetical protein